MEKKRWFIFLAIVCFSLILTIGLYYSSLTGKTVDLDTNSTVTIANYYAISLSDDLSNGIDFGSVTQLPTIKQNATKNNLSNGPPGYFITVSSDSNVNVSLCLNGTQMENVNGVKLTYPSYVWNDSLTGSASSPNFPGIQLSNNLTDTSTPTIAPGVNNYFRFWLDVNSSTPPGTYNNSILFKAVKTGDTCGSTGTLGTGGAGSLGLGTGFGSFYYSVIDSNGDLNIGSTSDYNSYSINTITGAYTGETSFSSYERTTPNTYYQSFAAVDGGTLKFCQNPTGTFNCVDVTAGNIWGVSTYSDPNGAFSGYVIAAYVDNDLYVYFSSDGVSWSPLQLATGLSLTQGDANTDIALDSLTNTYIFYRDTNDLYSYQMGGSAAPIATGVYPSRISATFDSSDYPKIVYYNENTDELKHTYYDSGFQTETIAANVNYPNMVYDSANDYTYVTGINTVTNTVVLYSNTGSGWESTDIATGIDQTYSDGVSMSQTPDGLFRIAYIKLGYVFVGEYDPTTEEFTIIGVADTGMAITEDSSGNEYYALNNGGTLNFVDDTNSNTYQVDTNVNGIPYGLVLGNGDHFLAYTKGSSPVTLEKAIIDGSTFAVTTTTEDSGNVINGLDDDVSSNYVALSYIGDTAVILRLYDYTDGSFNKQCTVDTTNIGGSVSSVALGPLDNYAYLYYNAANGNTYNAKVKISDCTVTVNQDTGISTLADIDLEILDDGYLYAMVEKGSNNVEAMKAELINLNLGLENVVLVNLNPGAGGAIAGIGANGGQLPGANIIFFGAGAAPGGNAQVVPVFMAAGNANAAINVQDIVGFEEGIIAFEEKGPVATGEEIIDFGSLDGEGNAVKKDPNNFQISCGDDVCTGDETVENCPEDCSVANIEEIPNPEGLEKSISDVSVNSAGEVQITYPTSGGLEARSRNGGNFGPPTTIVATTPYYLDGATYDNNYYVAVVSDTQDEIILYNDVFGTNTPEIVASGLSGVESVSMEIDSATGNKFVVYSTQDSIVMKYHDGVSWNEYIYLEDIVGDTVLSSVETGIDETNNLLFVIASTNLEGIIRYSFNLDTLTYDSSIQRSAQNCQEISYNAVDNAFGIIVGITVTGDLIFIQGVSESTLGSGYTDAIVAYNDVEGYNTIIASKEDKSISRWFSFDGTMTEQIIGAGTIWDFVMLDLNTYVGAFYNLFTGEFYIADIQHYHYFDAGGVIG